LLLVAALTGWARAQTAEPGAAAPATPPDGGSTVIAPPATGAAPATPAASPDRLSPTELVRGPSLYETGRIGNAPQAAPTTIVPEEELGARNEKSIQPAAAGLGNVPRRPAGVIDPRTLAREIDARFAALENCRVDVARNKRLAPAEVVGSTLTLRWTIVPGGETASTVVVATSPVDLELMDCVKAAMSRWHFTSPRGGPVDVEREFTFRPL
jgi:hypothetical protein